MMRQTGPSRYRLPLWKKAVFTLCGTAFSIIVLEAGLRLTGFALASLQEYRNREAISKKGAYRIMCLGESTTAGDAESYPSQLEEVLNQRNLGITFSVINKGMVGVNSITIISQIEDNLDRYHPDMVTAMMGDNDQYIKYYEDIPEAQTSLFNRFRTYKLFRLLWMNTANRIKKKGIYKPYSLIQPKNCYAQDMSPQNDRAYVALGLYYKEQGKHNQAKEALEKAVRSNPRNGQAYRELIWFYTYYKKYPQAEEMAKKAIAVNPRDDKVYMELGFCYRSQKKYERAAAAFKKAAELKPGNDVAYFESGGCYKICGKILKAQEAFRKAVEINPENKKACLALALLYQETGDYTLSRQYYEKINKLNSLQPNPVTTRNYLKLKEILDRRGIRLVCIQYPVRSIQPLKMMFQDQSGVIFVDNEKVFKDALKQAPYKDYFTDMFAGDFGHCTRRGNRLIAENIANVILKECFKN